MPGGSTRRCLLQRGTNLNGSRNVDTSSSQHSDIPPHGEELQRDNDVNEQEEQVEEDNSVTIPTQGYNPAVDPVTKKPPLEWKGNCFLNQKAARIIGKIWSRRFTGPWFKFKQVPPEIRNVLFDEFKRHFSYDEFHEPTIRRLWEAKAKDILKKKLNRAREEAKLAKKTTSILECKDHPPIWIQSDIWNEMIDVRWGKEEYEEKRKIMRNNRLTLKEGTCTRHCAGSVSIASHNEQIKIVTGKEPTFHETFQYWHVSGDPSNTLKNTKKISKSSAYVDNKSAKTMENYLKKKAESEEAMDIFNPKYWVDSSGGLTKGKVYGAPHVDVSSLNGGSQSSSTESHQRSTPAQPPSTQQMHTQFSLEEVGQWVLEKLRQSTMPIQSTVHTQTTNPSHVAMSSQPTVHAPHSIPNQSSMFTQTTMPAQAQQMGFSGFTGAFPRMTGNMSVPFGAQPSQHSPMPSNTFGTAQPSQHSPMPSNTFGTSQHSPMPSNTFGTAQPSQHSPMPSNTFGTAEQNMTFFDLMQQQYPFMQQFSQPSTSYQTPSNFEENQHGGGME